MKAAFLDFGTVANNDLDCSVLDAIFAGQVQYYATSHGNEVDERLADVDVVLANKIVFSAERLARASKLRLICLAATGTDNVDLEAARDRGIAVCNISAYCTASVVQHVFALILALNQQLPGYRDAVADGEWTQAGQFCVLRLPIRELTGRTLGIVGHGNLGSAVARAAEAFGLEVLLAARPGTAPTAGRVALEELLARADIVSLHCPLNETTRGLIGPRQLALMRPDALLINTARGALIDGQALADVLRAGKLGGAGIDVLPVEPPLPEEPLLAPGIPNLIVTPHIAWAARGARQRALEEMAANVAAFQRGERRNRVA